MNSDGRIAKAYDLLFWFVLAAAFFVRWEFVFSDKMLSDEALYAWSAQRILEHPQLIFSKEIIAYHPPLFPLLLAAGHLLFPAPVAIRLIPMLINWAGIILIYLIGRNILSPFAGLFAAIALAFDYLFIASGTNVLIDSPLTVAYMLLVWFLLKVNAESSRRLDWVVGVAGAALVLLKWSGILGLAITGFYYLVCLKGISLPRRLGRFFVPASVVLGVAATLLLNNYFQMGTIWPDTTALQGLTDANPPGYYFQNFYKIITLPGWLFVVLVGAGVVALREKDRSILSFLLFWFLLIFVSIQVLPSRIVRYAQPLLPPAFLLCGAGAEFLIERFGKNANYRQVSRVLAMVLLAAFYLVHYPKERALIAQNKIKCVGYAQAGEWLRAHDDGRTLLVSTSARVVRYFTGINFQEFGGRVVGLPGRPEDLESLAAAAPQRVLLVIDVWEPSWFIPMTSGKIERLKRDGFRLAHVVERYAYFPPEEYVGTMPVVWIFERPAAATSPQE